MRTQHALTALLFAALALAAQTARAADEARECADRFVSAQSRRAARDLTSAKRDFIACSQLGCPDMIVKECLQMLSEVERDLPTLGFRVTDGGGAELFDVEISLDGRVIASKLEGVIFEINPGIHELHVAAPGYRPHDASVSALPGERGRVLEIALEKDAPPPPAVAPAPAAPVARPAPAPERPFRVPAASIVAASVGVAALGSFAYFRLSGASDYDALESSCSPSCGDDEVDPVRRKYVFSAVSLAVSGAAFAAAGLTLWLGQPARAESGGGVALEVRDRALRVRARF